MIYEFRFTELILDNFILLKCDLQNIICKVCRLNKFSDFTVMFFFKQNCLNNVIVALKKINLKLCFMLHVFCQYYFI